jgi:hypothetical protein
MRRELAGVSEVEAMKEVIGIMKKTPSNKALLEMVAAKI